MDKGLLEQSSDGIRRSLLQHRGPKFELCFEQI